MYPAPILTFLSGERQKLTIEEGNSEPAGQPQCLLHHHPLTLPRKPVAPAPDASLTHRLPQGNKPTGGEFKDMPHQSPAKS
ncbi:hypothetical protein E2C01_075077 [Portunus trituberculatus]|uniref:Uncharacterized protein n=1 Tax=Portunus trituberculatus TaxID=210409 RepID=A0A5B7IFY6_PORTR|nr:hypothetical protein [Portunus trituberculatus]